MKRKLKLWELFIAEIRKEAIIKNGYDGYYVDIKWRNFSWLMSKDSIHQFGKTVDVKKTKENPNFTHISTDTTDGLYFYHESWFEPEFEPIELISEKDFEV